MSIIRHRSERGSDVRLILLYAVRTWEDVIFRDELFSGVAWSPIGLVSF
jgi:ferredoxin-NADP reductase